MTLLSTGEPIDPDQNYVVAGWASVNEGTEGPPIWDVVEAISANRAPSRWSPTTPSTSWAAEAARRE
jgi:sulfur-oxidizing protein SoxB